MTNIDAVFAHPLAADLDGDADLEILLTDNVTYSFPMGSGRLHAWHHDGTASADFPLVVMGGTTFLNAPCLGDMNDDGLLDLAARASDFNNNLSNISVFGSDVAWDPANVIIPCFQYNVRHDGLYPAAESVGTVAATFTCDPPSGTLPFSSTFSVSLENLYGGATRRIAARVNVTTGSGGFYGNWRSGYTNVAAGSAYTKAWNQVIPALGSLVGDNIFTLAAEDVTPAPYNQPPYPAAGDTATAGCTVTGLSP